MNMKIAICGGASGADPKANKKAEVIGRLISEKKHALITGACPGTPYKAAKAAFKAGGKVIGYSPATSLRQHKKNNEPADFFSELIFVPENYQHKKNIKACYKLRNIDLILASDKVILIGGRYGTLNEFTLAFDFEKEIGILTGTGGAADLCKNIVKKINKKSKAKIYYNSSPKKLLEMMGL